MPKFDQYHELAPDPVEYDFTAWGVKAFGVIPEPSPEQIRDFMRAQVALDADVKAKVAELDPDNPVLAPDSAADVAVIEDSLRRAAMFPEAEYKAAEDRANHIYAALCSNKPSAAQIGKLQSAPRTMFFRYVERCFLGPQLRLKGTQLSLKNGDGSTANSSTSSAPMPS
jgi:hypothetical protein